ncbi:MAG: YbjN domain-containing protein [Prochlorothrix sp.]|nr:YbjN domain-containing protein [Prochlorothrix sp.]
MTETEQVNHIDVIETVITSLREEGSALVSHDQGEHLWKFKYGSVEVLVQLSGLTDDDTLTVWSTVLPGPFKDELELLRQLMQLNAGETLEARFALVQGKIIVVSSRTVADLSPGEISRAITIVATLADDYDDPLIAKFQA